MSWDKVKEFIEPYDDFIWDFEVSKQTVEFLKTVTGNKHNSELAGQIENENEVPREKWTPHLVDDIMLKTFDPRVIEFLDSRPFLSRETPTRLDRLWVNHMKKYEFNPVHNHSGVLSFVIFCQIPYNLKDERAYFPETSSIDTRPSTFHMVLNKQGDFPKDICLPIDKDAVGKMLMFDSRMTHGVYPFYTSDEERITASGNIVFNVG